MNSQDIFEYIHYLEDTISELKAKITWHKASYWVSDDFKIPTERDSNGIRLVIEYDKNGKYPFKTADCFFWRYATPLTTEEMLKYSPIFT